MAIKMICIKNVMTDLPRDAITNDFLENLIRMSMSPALVNEFPQATSPFEKICHIDMPKIAKIG